MKLIRPFYLSLDGLNVQFQRMHLSDNRYGFFFFGTGLLLENTVIVGTQSQILI